MENTVLEASPIRGLQIMLRAINANDPHGALIVPDGIFGQETRKAVSEFQRTHSLPVTGVADLKTWQTIVKAYHRAEIDNKRAEPLWIVLQPQQVLKQGEKNIHIYMVQALFAALARLLGDVPRIMVNGTYDAATNSAVRWLQQRTGLPVSGSLDRQTWRHLANLYRVMIGDGSGKYPVRIAQRPLPGSPARE